MPSEMLKNAVALLYQKKGKDILTLKELELMITMDFRWFTPKEAGLLIEQAQKSGLIVKNKKDLKVNFNWRDREIPLEFSPSTKIFDEEVHRSCFSAIVDAIEQEVDIPRNEIVAEINKKQDLLNIAIETAALIVGTNHGVDMTAFYEMVDKELSLRFGQISG